MRRLFLGGLLAASLLSGCKKDDDRECLPQAPFSLADLTRRHGAPVQTFTLSPQVRGQVRTLGGTTIRFNAGAFVRPDRTWPTSPIRLEIREVQNPATMILTNLPTMSSYFGMLESGGMMSIRAYEGATRLKANRDSLVAYMPVPALNNDSLAGGMQAWTLTTLVSDTSIWQPLGVRVPRLTDPSNPNSPAVYAMSFWTDTISWLNCDAYWYDPRPRADVRVAFGGSLLNSRIYLIPTGRNAAFRPFPINDSLAIQSGVPQGLEFAAVVLREKDGQVYLGIQKAVARDGFVFRPRQEALSEAEIVRRIRQL